jgi:hypothetical protein
MLKEKANSTEKDLPVTICPDCVHEGMQIDPRAKTPAYPVIESTCFTHLIIRGEILPISTNQ